MALKQVSRNKISIFFLFLDLSLLNLPRPVECLSVAYFVTVKCRSRFFARTQMSLCELRARFLKKIQDCLLKSEGIRKGILSFFTRQNNPRSLGSWCIKGTEESTLEADSSVPLMHHDSKYLGLISSIEKRKIHFRTLSNLGFS